MSAAARLVIATTNRGKLAELAPVLQRHGWLPLGLADLPSVAVPAEDGATFADNARAKALHYARATGLPALADDSGLCVDALDGAPGVHSARFAGVAGAGRDAANNRLLLERLRGVPPERRGAEFRCALAVAGAGRILLTAEGVVRGRILEAPDGDRGFGYDPLFYHVESGASFARLDPAVKAALGHRGRAMQILRASLASALHGVQQ